MLWTVSVSLNHFTRSVVIHHIKCHFDVQWKVAQETGTYKAAPTDAGEPAPAVPATMGSLMAFDGPAPEIVNGRLAMLGFVAALGAELSSGESVMMQVCPSHHLRELF